MPRDPVTFRRRFIRDIGTFGVSYARPKVPSRTLRAATRFEIDSDTAGRIRIPHYWALYVHDGRGPFSMPFGRFLVWFKDPRLDPRLTGGQTPERASSLRHLTAEQFAEARRAGLIIVARQIRKATPPTRFFDNGPGGGMDGFATAVNAKFGVRVQEYLLDQIGKDVLQVTDTATLRLG